MRGDEMVDLDTIQYMTRNEADMSFKMRARTVFEYVDPTDDMLILDLPCGRGFYLNMFRYVSQCHLVGADLDWDVVLKAQQNVGHLDDVDIQGVNIYQMPYADNTFDAVILSEVLEHLDDDEQALKEAYRVLKPNGVLAVTVPHANYPFLWDPINKTLETLFNRHIQHGVLAGIWANHVRLYQPEQLRNAVLSAGFVVEDERAFTHHCFPFIHNLVYGIGMPLLESGALPSSIETASNRLDFDKNNGSLLNPINLGVAIFNFFDRKNVPDEGHHRSTVNLAVKGRKPHV
jgi:SAM-dependent methyltransferase